MADSETEAPSGWDIASVLKMLDDLTDKYDLIGQDTREDFEEKEELTRDEIDSREGLLDELKFNLLPPLQTQLSSLVTSLALPRDWRKSPPPDFQIIGNVLEDIEETADEILDLIRSIALDIQAVGTGDHRLKRCKQFRITHLLNSIEDLVSLHVRGLFISCHGFLRESKLSRDHPEDRTHPRVIRMLERGVHWEMGCCTHSIKKIIGWCDGPDFDVLQTRWQEKAQELDRSLGLMTELSHHTMSRQRNTSALRKHVIKLGQFTIPIIKLVRMFSNKISKTNAFTLDSELNSEMLARLHKHPQKIDDYFFIHGRKLLESYKQNELEGNHVQMRSQIVGISDLLESFLVFLAFHHIPLPRGIGRSSPESHFKTWFSEWQHSWHVACNNFSLILLGFQDGQQQLGPAA
ncbi:hypothetical protein PTTG_12668 [Puccinia triticina 1-1 BBBD Race 1]|uniref:Uncharacterized protein n=2 Tax=Puccinia triticina TaxID=208348 RepID=A0A180H2C4_PUCT1|nr:uncharacterized protein PtA15_4A149 [Puccinia triticina]OAV99155.1 hypothetical protein PTTG_12668 [Puccinia triticina 1-1 BBBD Race 1]WAQ83701.1 hypothetical protein PtA15_4A149 [Puccinia triticina]